MNKIFILQLLLILFIGTFANAQTKETEKFIDSINWIGKFTYTYTEGKTQGGWIPVIEYGIDVTKEGESLLAQVTADGYQSNEKFICTAKISGDPLNLYFLKDSLSAVRPTGENGMRRGELVGSLNKSVVRGRVRYEYRDDAFILRGVMRTPVYFKKSR